MSLDGAGALPAPFFLSRCLCPLCRETQRQPGGPRPSAGANSIVRRPPQVVVRGLGTGDWLLPVCRRPWRRSSTLAFVSHPLADEIAQPGSFFRDDFEDMTVLLGHQGDARQLIHPFL